MLRTSLRSVRGPGGRAIAAAAGRQWQAAAACPARAIGQRYYADDKKFGSSIPQPAVIPPSETRTAAEGKLPSESAPKAIPAEEVPSTPPPPPPPRKKGFFRRLRNYVLTLSVLGALAFGGGVWYSRVNDNFHDFFTEYVPYGEQAVLYLEEMDFRKRFPRISQRGAAGGAGSGGDPKSGAANVSIPAQSGASWRVADSPEPAKRQSSAVKEAKTAAAQKSEESKAKSPAPAAAPTAAAATLVPTTPAAPKENPAPAADTTPVAKAPQPVEEPAAPAASESKKSRKRRSSSTSAPAPAPVTPASIAQANFKPPEVDEPSRWPPASPIDPLAVKDASEPVVQDLVRMLNDMIAVINADGAEEKYSATVGKAKDEINRVGQKIRDMKRGVEAEAAKQVKAQSDNLQTYATDLIERLEAHMTAQEKRWRAEFESELARLQESYENRVRTMTERERRLNEEKLQNRLLEQAIELQRRFAADVQERVERERDGRLGRLEELSAAVSELDGVAAGLAHVVDAAKRTQQLHVAVEAVRATLEASSAAATASAGPAAARPFVRELVALKEIAAGDPVVDAAIASINPTAYQRGVSSPAELIDRFRRVAGEVRKAALLPVDAGVASHASSWALSKVMFRKQGLADGDDVESVLARAQKLLEEGELDAAAREVNGLTGWAKTLSRDWLAEVRKVLEVQQALDVIQAEARLQSLRVE